MDKKKESRKIHIIHNDHTASDKYKSKLIMSGLVFGSMIGFVIGFVIGLLIGMSS